MGHSSSFPQLREGSVVIITGASSGLGKELALNFASEKACLVLAGRDKDRLKQVQKACLNKTSSVQVFEGDLTNPQTCKKLISLTVKLYKRIDFLVLNAGINAHFQFSKLQDLSVFDSLIRTNLYPNIYLTKYALKNLKNSKGAIIVISSLSGKFGLPARSAYCASKFALNGFFEAIRTEEEVPVMMVYPTSLETPMRSNSLIKTQSQSQEKREDPKKCASLVLSSIHKGREQVYLPWKGWLGVVLQPLFPRLMRWKVTQSAKL